MFLDWFQIYMRNYWWFWFNLWFNHKIKNESSIWYNYLVLFFKITKECKTYVKMSPKTLSHLIHFTPSSSSSETSLSPGLDDTRWSEFRSVSEASPLWLLPAVLPVLQWPVLVLPSRRMASLGPNRSSSPFSMLRVVS